ncbi:serine/threonine-protein kinase [Vitiosangium sp. GDMCC 1.1324]|uniref:serine/threonine-protein kinase n=1 Tax=Vitiosangium sp. (strain GDMCC 1.1324) TaxID=2138576 RepID=UPI00130DF6E5|nr:serine/threonine-protein kinase [Vitiosangium sp. GDMCC 1.1324]
MHGLLAESPASGAPEQSSEEENALVGRRLGDYQVRRCIGRGGMGIVYEAEHVAIGRRVAVKVLREDHARSPHARDLLSEARAAGAIQHRGIIDVFGFGQEPGIGQYLVMEYLEGLPLSELLEPGVPLAPSRVLRLLGEVLEALSAAHARGVIHRDLKPSNIFVVLEPDGTESVKVLDFGLAKRSTVPDGTAPQTRSDLIVGTPHYMAPEQALSEAVSPRTDLYAVGVIAFEMFTGRRPFPGRSSMEIVAHHLKSPPPRLSSYVELPPPLDELVLRLLAKEPAQRPGSASEVARELRALLQEPERPGSPPPPVLTGPKLAPALAFMDEPTLQRPSAASGSHAGEGQALPARSPSLVTPAPSAPLATPAPSLSPFTPAPSLSPVTPAPSPLPESPPLPVPVRGPRWRQGAVAGGLLVLALGGILVLGREPAPEAPGAEVPGVARQRPAPVSPVSPPPAVTPSPEPHSTPASSPARATSLASKRQTRPAPAQAAETPPAKPEASGPDSHGPASATQAAAPPTPPEADPSSVATRTTGTLRLIVKGAWADVWVDGEMLGRVPPLHSYVLPAGEHELELRNPGLEPHHTKIVISPGELLTYTTRLEPAEQASSPP